jgi:hypothetical protein
MQGNISDESHNQSGVNKVSKIIWENYLQTHPPERDLESCQLVNSNLSDACFKFSTQNPKTKEENCASISLLAGNIFKMEINMKNSPQTDLYGLKKNYLRLF